MQYFIRNSPKLNQASVALNILVSLFYRLVVRGGRNPGNRQTDGQTDEPITVTLTAHALRGLTSCSKPYIGLLYPCLL